MNTNTRNLLLSLKNCSTAKLNGFYFKFSQKSMDMLNSLYQQGFIQSFLVLGNNTQIYVLLRYFDNKPTFQHLKLLSTSLKSKNITFSELSRLFNKRFVLFLNTDKGIATLYQCKKQHISGKTLFFC